MRGQLTGLAHVAADGFSTLDQLAYGYDGAGRLTTETDAGGRLRQFGYDDLGQLVQEHHPDLGAGGTQYHYDLNGNRTRVARNGVTEWYGVDAADKLLWTNGVNSAPNVNQSGTFNRFEYDGLGNLTHRDRKPAGGALSPLNFDWDGDGRLRRAYRPAGPNVLNATYTADGERIAKLSTAEQRFSFGLYEESNFGNRTLTPGFSEFHAGSHRFFHGDWLGGTRYLTDAAGAPTYQKRFDAYGKQTYYDGTDTSTAVAHQYAGAWGYQRENEELGLDLLHHRYYDPAVGRFISRDPIGWAGGLNLYGYVGNNPVGAVDPSGLSPDGGVDEYWLTRGVNALRPLSRIERIAISAPGLSNPLTNVNVLSTIESLHDSWANWGCEEGLGDGGRGNGMRLLGARVSAWAQTVGVATSITGAGSMARLIRWPAGRAAAVLESGGCFPAGTPIRTRDGEKPIEQVRVGDEVLAADPETGEQSYQRVTRAYVREVGVLLQIVTADGRSIQATTEHPFWVEGKGFVAARNLQVGDLLRDYREGRVRIGSLVEWRGHRTVYNFDVTGTHTYYAGGWLVHNVTCPEAIILRGRLGGEAHRNLVDEIAESLRVAGYGDVRPELYVKMPWRARGRFADISGINPATGQRELFQVGKQTKGGLPVARERSAIADLLRAGYTDTFFVPYN